MFVLYSEFVYKVEGSSEVFQFPTVAIFIETRPPLRGQTFVTTVVMSNIERTTNMYF